MVEWYTRATQNRMAQALWVQVPPPAQKFMNEADVKERWENYRKANTDKPLVRNNELQTIFTLLNPQAGEVILEVGTGNGYLTFPIGGMIGSGKVITADVGEDNLESVDKRNTQNLPIETFLFNDKDLFHEIADNTLDGVSSIATLHHFDNRQSGSGESGRVKALAEFYRLLKPGGRLVMADVAYNTISQQYFDAIDNPQHCFPTGHPHDFFTTERLKDLLTEIGFKDINIEIKKVPWAFTSEDEAVNFIHVLHNAKCSPAESFEVAKEYLGFSQVGDHYELGWELFFVVARK